MAVRELRIVNEKGLHARASAKFVEVVEQFDADAQVEPSLARSAPDEVSGRVCMIHRLTSLNSRV